MFGVILILFVYSIIVITLIHSNYKQKTPKWLAFLPIIAPAIGVLLMNIDEKLAFFYILLCFSSIIFILLHHRFQTSLLFSRISRVKTEKSNKKPTSVLGISLSGIEFDGITNPIIPILYRIFILIAIFFNLKNIADDDIFYLEFKFQLISTVVLVGIALLAVFNKFSFKDIPNINPDKEFPTDEAGFAKIKRTINIIIIIGFIVILYFMDAHLLISKMMKTPQNLALNLALIVGFIAGIFLILSQPLNALKIYFLKGVEMFSNYIYAIFIGVAVMLPLSIIWKGDLPVLMLGFNILLLYNEIVIYKYYLKQKNEKNPNNN